MEERADKREVIGRASATEREPTTAERFRFWIRPGQRVNPFDIVVAEHLEGSRTFGLVTNIAHVTDAAGHLANFVSNDFGESVEEPNTPRQGVNVAEAAVLANDRDIYMPVQSEARIWFADEEGIHKALGIDVMRRKEEQKGKRICVPAGLIELSNGTSAVAYLDVEYVLGPEGGHVNVSGISGLATKTSYVMFLIQSILQSVDSDRIAVILLNVKYDDLLHIHDSRDLTDEERQMWERLGLEPKPWPEDRVHYLLPCGHHTQTTKRPNSFGDDLPPNHKVYAYDLHSTVDKLDLLFSHVPDPWDTLEPLIGEIKDGILGKKPDQEGWKDVNTWDDLLEKSPISQQGVQKGYRNVAASTVRRFLRILRRIVKTRQSGLFVGQLADWMTTIAEEIGRIQGGHTYVVDIARLRDEEQTLVFGDILRTVYGLYSGEVLLEDDRADKLPEKVIIFVDELNKYAPAGHRDSSPILEYVLDIAERGRSFGIILFSAQQFMSAVHPRVTGNAATKVLGRTDSAEINQANYRFLDNEIKMHATRLNHGELILSHPVYRQPVKIRFPKPPFRQSR